MQTVVLARWTYKQRMTSGTLKQPVKEWRGPSGYSPNTSKLLLRSSKALSLYTMLQSKGEGIRPITCYFLMLCSRQLFMLFWESSSKWGLEGVHISEGGYCDAWYAGICHFLIIDFTKRFKKI